MKYAVLLGILLLDTAVTAPVIFVPTAEAQTYRQDKEDLDEDNRRYDEQRTRAGKKRFEARERSDCDQLRRDAPRSVPSFCCDTFGICARR
jgi:hypothetical protein